MSCTGRGCHEALIGYADRTCKNVQATQLTEIAGVLFIRTFSATGVARAREGRPCRSRREPKRLRTEGRGSEAEERCTVAKPGQSPATPTLAKPRRVLGDLISGYGNKRTHMIQIYATNLHSTLDAALWLRNVATDAERKELDSIEARARVLLLHAANPDSNKINR